jgi:hypothetical protein
MHAVERRSTPPQSMTASMSAIMKSTTAIFTTTNITSTNVTTTLPASGRAPCLWPCLGRRSRGPQAAAAGLLRQRRGGPRHRAAQAPRARAAPVCVHAGARPGRRRHLPLHGERHRRGRGRAGRVAALARQQAARDPLARRGGVEHGRDLRQGEPPDPIVHFHRSLHRSPRHV